MYYHPAINETHRSHDVALLCRIQSSSVSSTFYSAPNDRALTSLNTHRLFYGIVIFVSVSSAFSANSSVSRGGETNIPRMCMKGWNFRDSAFLKRLHSTAACVDSKTAKLQWTMRSSLVKTPKDLPVQIYTKISKLTSQQRILLKRAL